MDWGSLIVDIEPAGSVTLLEYFKAEFTDITDNSQDQSINRALEQAGAMIERWLDVVIAKREVTEHFPHHFDTVVLHNLPVDDPVVVTLNGNSDANYKWYKDKGGLAHLTRSGWAHDIPMDWRRYDQVDVTYTSGYDPLPLDLAYALGAFSAMILATEGSAALPSISTGDMKQFQLYDVGSVSYDTGSASMTAEISYQSGLIPPNIAEMLYSYRRITV